ncbi:MAG: FG-GAP repeat protein [Deltaproteobacteria bacterium]|nr:FG-GAP repeat protein [Deltaproteobacteria bacterium]
MTAYSSLEVEVGDFDGDGYDDVVFGGYHAGSWSSTAYTMIYYGSSLGLSSSVYDALSSNGAHSVEAEDLDNDGYTDLVVPHYYNGSSHSTTSYVYYGSATGMSSTNRDSMTTSYYSGAWTSAAYSLIFNGSASGYSSSASVNSLADRGVWGTPVLVGNTAW